MPTLSRWNLLITKALEWLCGTDHEILHQYLIGYATLVDSPLIRALLSRSCARDLQSHFLAVGPDANQPLKNIAISAFTSIKSVALVFNYGYGIPRRESIKRLPHGKLLIYKSWSYQSQPSCRC